MKKIIKISSKICGAFLAVLGFSAAVTSCMKYGMPSEYGMPSADYFIDGNIVSEQTNDPIENLKVRWVEKEYQNYPIDSIYTNESGKFSFISRGYFPIYEYSLDIQDIDGDANGEFNDTTINIQINQNDYKGGDGHWYKGKYHKTFDIELKSKN